MKRLIVSFLFIFNLGFSQTNHSLSFDGTDDYVDLASKPITGTQNQFSILAYFKTNSLSINQGIYFHGGGYKDVGLRIDEEGSEYKLHFFILTSGGSQGHTYAPAGTIDTGVWHQVAGTYDGQTVKLYVDGNLITETTFSANVDWDQGTQFGPSIGGGNSQCPPFDGNIDEMSFWTVTLSQTEIQSYMSTSPSGTETDLAAYWNFNEGTGTTLTDQTSNDNDGTIYGATWDTDNGIGSTTGTFTYTPTANYNGSDSFVYSASDGTLSDTATVSITITAVDDIPVASSYTVTINEDTDYSGTLMASDGDGDALTFSIIDSTV
ncbi:uncharacterized protein METZ01_LOCUS289169, partial [marine metagenome]